MDKIRKKKQHILWTIRKVGDEESESGNRQADTAEIRENINTDIHKRTLKNKLSELVEEGYLNKSQRQKHESEYAIPPNLYTLTGSAVDLIDSGGTSEASAEDAEIIANTTSHGDVSETLTELQNTVQTLSTSLWEAVESLRKKNSELEERVEQLEEEVITYEKMEKIHDYYGKKRGELEKRVHELEKEEIDFEDEEVITYDKMDKIDANYRQQIQKLEERIEELESDD